MRVYREHLRVPWPWWLIGLAVAAVLGTELAAGLNLLLAVTGYAVIALVIGAVLTRWSWPVVEVRDGELRAGRARLPLARAGEVSALDQAQSRQLRGPRADPAAFVLTRPYLKTAVYIEVSGGQSGEPYWLVGTRHPAELAGAIENSRPAAVAGDAPVG
jgi:uncharacterized protein (DUF58 family)